MHNEHECQIVTTICSCFMCLCGTRQILLICFSQIIQRNDKRLEMWRQMAQKQKKKHNQNHAKSANRKQFSLNTLIQYNLRCAIKFYTIIPKHNFNDPRNPKYYTPKLDLRGINAWRISCSRISIKRSPQHSHFTNGFRINSYIMCRKCVYLLPPNSIMLQN